MQTKSDLINNLEKVLIIAQNEQQIKAAQAKLSLPSSATVKHIKTFDDILYIADDRESFKNTGIYPERNFQANFKFLDGKFSLIQKAKSLLQQGYTAIFAFQHTPKSELTAYIFYQHLTQHRESIIRLDGVSQLAGQLLAQVGKRLLLADKLFKYAVSPIVQLIFGIKSLTRADWLLLCQIQAGQEINTNNAKIKPNRQLFSGAQTTLLGKQLFSFLHKYLCDLPADVSSSPEALTKFFNSLRQGIERAQLDARIDALQTDEPCPVCGGEMLARRNKYGKLFYGCKRYPVCNGTRSKC